MAKVENDCYIMTDRPAVDEHGEYYIPLYYRFPFANGVNIENDSALIRPFKRILRDGKPIGNLTFIFYESDSVYYILGSFVKTKKRLLFFPGFNDLRVTRDISGESILKRGILNTIDHFSLEENNRLYHTTLLEKETENVRYPNGNTLRIKDDLYFWLLIGVKNEQCFELAPSTQLYRLRGKNQNDLNRRHTLIYESRKNAVFNIVSIDDKNLGQYYLNIEIFLSYGIGEFPEIKIFPAGVAMRGWKDSRKDIMTRLHKIDIPEFEGTIWIRLSKIAGTILGDAIYVNVDGFKNMI
jgi:hypothetical protein